MSWNFLVKAAVRKVLRQENLRKPDGIEDLPAKKNRKPGEIKLFSHGNFTLKLV